MMNIGLWTEEDEDQTLTEHSESLWTASGWLLIAAAVFCRAPALHELGSGSTFLPAQRVSKKKLVLGAKHNMVEDTRRSEECRGHEIAESPTQSQDLLIDLRHDLFLKWEEWGILAEIYLHRTISTPVDNGVPVLRKRRRNMMRCRSFRY